ncbi:hypothetical protein [Acinetobacter ursingii]|uniref:hypothetical protein n=1 Tax=Acinetobacter ursingii TaxID=108980 RepID=UPI00300A15CB
MKDIVVLGNADNIIELSDYRVDEVALAKISQNVFWLEGDSRCFNSETKQWFERNSGSYISSQANTASFNVLDKILRDIRSNNDAISSTSYASYQCDIPNIVSAEMTAVFVIKKINKNANIIYAAGRNPNNGEDVSKKLLRAGVNADGKFTWWDSLGITFYLQYVDSALLLKLNAGETLIMTLTASKYNGCKMYLNGNLVASTQKEFTLADNTLILNGSANCHRGHTLLYKTDLSLSPKQLDLLHNTLKSYYNIV